MTNTRTTARPILTPAQVADLVVLPTLASTAVGAACTVVHIAAAEWRIPRVAADPTAAWVDEGEEIPVSDAEFDELTVTPAKLAGLSIVTSELAADSSPQATKAIGDGLVRDLARKIDAAFFGNLAAPAPAGLAALAGVTTTAAPASGYTGFDALMQAISAAERVGARIDTWVMHPDDVVALSMIRTATGSNMPMLGVGQAAPGQRAIFGVPVVSSPNVKAGAAWGIPRDRTYCIVRDNATVESDTSTFFTSDRIVVRAKMRLAFGFPHPAAIVKVNLGTGK